jgi:hypothetical protein
VNEKLGWGGGGSGDVGSVWADAVDMLTSVMAANSPMTTFLRRTVGHSSLLIAYAMMLST